MTQFSRSTITAVLGPTNTGKTHLAVERLCGHSSGVIGFPLRLLAREVYDRVVAIKGANSVALLTGEERIVPRNARYFLCTAESMPVLSPVGGMEDGQAAFVAIDEAQLGIDPERGHVFTDRMLHARGREETMILGSESLRPMVRALVPDAEIVTRPRFSTLGFTGASRLQKLPRRSVIVAFSAEQVYALAETVRRLKGGAAIVMGALSPSTRNAQVAMFQAGEVDYLIATDAIGMGLNMDVGHVAFAGLTKFDGKRQRRLTVPEMAQIAGRAGRHQRDGTFGILGGEAKPGFRPEEIAAIEEHRFASIEHLYWRDYDPRFDSIDTLIADLETPPRRPELRAAPLATDLAVLKLLADDSDVAATAVGPAAVQRLWAACGLPDFQKTGPWHHARTIQRLWQFLGSGNGTIDRDWYSGRLEKLDTPAGDVENVAARIAAVRTWAYIAHRPDWLDDPAAMAGRAAEIEAGLSDALHEKLTQRFVDRRTSVLLRDLGKGMASLPVAIGPDGAVAVDGEPIGMLQGFRFTVDAEARASDRKLLLAAADRHLAKELRTRAHALVRARSIDMALIYEPGEAPRLAWKGHPVATLGKGRDLLHPGIKLDASVEALDRAERDAIATRLRSFLDDEIARLLAPLAAADALSRSADSPPELRAVLAPLVDAGGILPRHQLDAALRQLGKEGRGPLHPLKLVIGTLDIFMPPVLKPAAAELRAALMAAEKEKLLLPLPAAGVVVMDLAEGEARMGAQRAGFRMIGDQMLRVDMVERVARNAHEKRLAALNPPSEEAPKAEPAKEEPAKEENTKPETATETAPAAKPAQNGRLPFAVPADFATSLGLREVSTMQLMRDMGFRPVAQPDAAEPPASIEPESKTEKKGGDAKAEAVSPPAPAPLWTWHGLRPVRHRNTRSQRTAQRRDDKPRPPLQKRDDRGPKPSRPAKPKADRATANPFADLKDLMKGGGKD